MIDSIPAQSEEEKRRVERFQQMTPEKIAPLVVYLGSDRAEGITGQVFGVRNNEVFLFNQPRPIRSIHRSDGWTPEKLDAQLKGAFSASLMRVTPPARTIARSSVRICLLSSTKSRWMSPSEVMPIL